MADVLVYVLHYEGAFNKNSLGAISEGAARAAEIGGACDAVVVGGSDLTDDLCKTLGSYGARKVFRAEGPEGLAQPVVDVLDKVMLRSSLRSLGPGVRQCSKQSSMPLSIRHRYLRLILLLRLHQINEPSLQIYSHRHY